MCVYFRSISALIFIVVRKHSLYINTACLYTVMSVCEDIKGKSFSKPTPSSWYIYMFFFFNFTSWSNITYCMHTGMGSNEFEWGSQFIFHVLFIFFRVCGVNWIDGSDACVSQEQYNDLLFWLCSCYRAVHYWFHFFAPLLPLIFACASYCFLLSRSVMPLLCSSVLPASPLSAFI